MLKFKGRKADLDKYLATLMEDYGRRSTLKDVCRMVGAYYGNV